MPGTDNGTAALRALVRSRRIHYRLVPDFDLVDGARARVGFRLLLFGAHEGGTHPLPGCERCPPLFRDLQRVAQSLLGEDGALIGLVEPFNRALYDDPALAMDDVALSVQLRPRSSLEDPAAVRALALLRQRLHELGVYEVTWQATAS